MAVMLKLACVLLPCMVVVAPYVAEGAISCGTVVSKMTPCIGYLIGGALPPSCCGGLKSLVAAAKTTHNRQAAWNCLKSAAGGISGINYGYATSLRGKCGVSLP